MYQFTIRWFGIKQIIGRIAGKDEYYTHITTNKGITYTLEHKDILDIEEVA